MNYSQSFEEFSRGLGPTDLALYAGIGIILFILFKDKMSPVQKMVLDLVNQVKNTMNTPAKTPPVVGPIPDFVVPSATSLVRPEVSQPKQDVFFDLVTSWKKTRDLAVVSKCSQAVEALDNTFQYLSPNICDKKTENE